LLATVRQHGNGLPVVANENPKMSLGLTPSVGEYGILTPHTAGTCRHPLSYENKQSNEAAAHVRQDQPGAWIDHPLGEHLVSVGSLAAGFAAFRPSDAAWARLAGLWHDLGKYRPGFQTYLRQANDPDAHIEGKVGGREKTHSAAGALWVRTAPSRGLRTTRSGREPSGQIASRQVNRPQTDRKERNCA
jgi:hypothetical protein